MPNKCMLVLLDGLGDRAYPEFENQTPLQAARTPCLDRLATIGANGTYHATHQGQALPSENAHFAIFGYDSRWFPGRGPLEALGAGIDLGTDDVAVLSHFANFRSDNDSLVLVNGKLNIDVEDIHWFSQLAAFYEQAGIQVRFHHTHKGYGIVTLHGHVAPFFTDTDPVTHGMPLIEPLPLAGYEENSAAVKSAAVIKGYLLHIYYLLGNCAMNKKLRQKGLETVDGLVTQRAGRLKPVPNFTRRYGLKGMSIASGRIYHGLSRYLGLDYIKVSDSDDPAGDLADRINQAHRSVAEYDFIHVHTKVADEAGHTKNPEMKKNVIEALDEGLAQAIEPVLSDPDVLLVVTADHCTPSGGPLIHSAETVPLLFCGSGMRRDHVTSFDEVSVVQGALGQVRGRELMLMILNALDRAKLQGLMDTPVNQPYWPGDYELFKVT